MRDDQGDILPDRSDDVRYDLIKHKVSFYKKIMEGCEKCGGKGNINKNDASITCECKKSFSLILEMLKSNFPVQHLGINNEDFFERKVVEINQDEQSKKKPKPLDFSVILKYFVSHKKSMIANSHSFVFAGNNESGKTYGALLLMESFIRAGYSSHYLRFKNYLNLLNSAYNNPDDKKLLNQIKNVKILVIDELGKEHGKNEYASAELEELIKFRQDNISCTIFITNLDYEDFCKVYGEHVKSALSKNYHIMIFHPDSNFRKRTRVKWDLKT